jgi:acyl carrier protein
MMKDKDAKPGAGAQGAANGLAAAIRAILAEKLRRPLEDITPASKLESDLGIDSMAMIDINIALEERFKFTMPDFAEPNEINLETVADLVALVAARSADAPTSRGRS